MKKSKVDSWESKEGAGEAVGSETAMRVPEWEVETPTLVFFRKSAQEIENKELPKSGVRKTVKTRGI
jgi:hypothetical protein